MSPKKESITALFQEKESEMVNEGLIAGSQEKELKEFKSVKSETCFTASPNNRASYNPNEVFYLSTNGNYFVDVGTHYRINSKWSPVRAGVNRHFLKAGINKSEARDLISDAKEDIEVDRSVDWAGSIAGMKKGKHDLSDKSLLIVDEPRLFDSIEGKFPLLNSIVNQAFTHDTAKHTFLGWLRDGIEAVRLGKHQPAPMMVLAGEANSGKSLLAWVTKQLLGGRSADPMTSWAGKLVWNDDLLGAELLLIDDSSSSIDIRARRALGANFKSSIYAGDVAINTRGKSTIHTRPVWRVMICCNQEPENLAIIPPLENDIKDKITLLKVAKIETPMPARTPEEKATFQTSMIEELPAFQAYLMKLDTPCELVDSRAGVKAWQDPSLVSDLKNISPEGSLEDLLERAIESGYLKANLWYSASKVTEKLTDRESPTHRVASDLLRHTPATGRYLNKLYEAGSHIITNCKELGARKKEYYISSGEVVK